MPILHGGAKTNDGKTVKEVKTYGVGTDGKANTEANPQIKVADVHGKVEWKRSKDVKSA
jgi:hypothetical protein